MVRQSCGEHEAVAAVFNVKPTSLGATKVIVAFDHLEALARDRLERLHYRSGILGGFIAGNGLALDEPTYPEGQISVIGACRCPDTKETTHREGRLIPSRPLTRAEPVAEAESVTSRGAIRRS